MSRRPVKRSGHTKPENPDKNLSLQLKKEINREIASLLPKEQREQIATRVNALVMSTHEAFSGPIPHPGHLQAYENILPGSAERVFSMAEREQDHNQEMQRTIVTASAQISRWAMFLGFIAFIALVSGAIVAGISGNNTLAYALLGTGVLGGATTLIRGRNKDANAASAVE